MRPFIFCGLDVPISWMIPNAQFPPDHKHLSMLYKCVYYNVDYYIDAIRIGICYIWNACKALQKDKWHQLSEIFSALGEAEVLSGILGRSKSDSSKRVAAQLWAGEDTGILGVAGW